MGGVFTGRNFVRWTVLAAAVAVLAGMLGVSPMVAPQAAAAAFSAQSIDIPKDPTSIAISPVGDFTYVASATSGALTRVNGFQTTTPVPYETPMGWAAGIRKVVIDRKGQFAYAAATAGGILRVDTSKDQNAVTTFVGVGMNTSIRDLALAGPNDEYLIAVVQNPYTSQLSLYRWNTADPTKMETRTPSQFGNDTVGWGDNTSTITGLAIDPTGRKGVLRVKGPNMTVGGTNLTVAFDTATLSSLWTTKTGVGNQTDWMETRSVFTSTSSAVLLLSSNSFAKLDAASGGGTPAAVSLRFCGLPLIDCCCP